MVGHGFLSPNRVERAARTRTTSLGKEAVKRGGDREHAPTPEERFEERTRDENSKNGRGKEETAFRPRPIETNETHARKIGPGRAVQAGSGGSRGTAVRRYAVFVVQKEQPGGNSLRKKNRKGTLKFTGREVPRGGRAEEEELERFIQSCHITILKNWTQKTGVRYTHPGGKGSWNLVRRERPSFRN